MLGSSKLSIAAVSFHENAPHANGTCFTLDQVDGERIRARIPEGTNYSPI